MIIEAIVRFLTNLVVGIISFFPQIPTIDLSFLDGIFKIISLIDTFISLRVVSVCIVVIFIFMNAQVIWGVIMWVVRKIPGVE